jgi:hypothetical protein
MLRPTRLAIVGLAIGATIFAACSSDTDPASAETCGELEDMTIEFVQEMIDMLEADDVTIEEIQSTTESPLSDEQTEKMQTQTEGIESRWYELACPGETSDIVVDRVDELTYTKRIGEYLIGGVTDSG